MASEEVVVDLMKKKCLPILFYAIEVCPLNEAHINSPDFAVGICFTKIFCTGMKFRDTIIQSICGYLTQSVKILLTKESKIS